MTKAADPTPEQIAEWKAKIAAVEQRDRDAAQAERDKADASRKERYAKLAEITRSPAYAEVRDKLAAIASEFMSEGMHVPYLSNALAQVGAMAEQQTPT